MDSNAFAPLLNTNQPPRFIIALNRRGGGVTAFTAAHHQGAGLIPLPVKATSIFQFYRNVNVVKVTLASAGGGAENQCWDWSFEVFDDRLISRRTRARRSPAGVRGSEKRPRSRFRFINQRPLARLRRAKA